MKLGMTKDHMPRKIFNNNGEMVVASYQAYHSDHGTCFLLHGNE